VKLSQLRKKVAERLVAVKNETAMLTTFNEVDMSAVKDVRARFRDRFEEQHGVRLGIMSFFTRAVCESLAEYPTIGSILDEDELITPEFADIGVAVSAPKGLVVPVVRDAHKMTFAQIETTIADLAERARGNKLTMDDLSGGNFTITNGGVFGSLLSTPILNPPQSAILGMHVIQERPIAIDGEMFIRPMMYVALSYDHRVVDGKESVGFLKRVKELLEDPVRLLLGLSA
jgi:2-oxoglutarate dehydrogenase E2 component (dihydrolipoamide succinyltransferase)